MRANFHFTVSPLSVAPASVEGRFDPSNKGFFECYSSPLLSCPFPLAGVEGASFCAVDNAGKWG